MELKKPIISFFDSYAKLMLLVAVLSRVSFAALVIMISLKTENGFLVSPFVEIRFGDYDFYSLASTENFALLKEPFIFFYEGGSLVDWVQRTLVPGPMFPWLLNVLNYPKQPIILATIYLIASSLLIFGWVLYYRIKEVPVWGQLAFIAFPLILWYSIVLSTELLMMIALFIFFCGALVVKRMSFMGIFLALVGFMLMLLIRPNSLCLFPAMLLVIFINKDVMSRWFTVAIIVLVTSIFLYFVVYYIPYFYMVNESASVLSYWGMLPQQYYEGIFPNLPHFLDKVISTGALIISKVIYASGIRPSYSESAIIFVFLRGMGGILILPGIFYCIVRGSWLERSLLFGFLFPLLITVAQERYLLPIAPLLLLYGGIFWKDLYLLIRKHFCS